MAHGTFSLSSFAIRLLVSLFVVLATYNPTGYSLVHWLIERAAGPLSLKLLASIGLAILYYAVFRIVLAAFRLPGLIAALLVIVLGGMELATLFSSQTPTPWRVYVVLGQYAVLFAMAVILSLGVSWSWVIERLTGQLQKRYVRY